MQNKNHVFGHVVGYDTNEIYFIDNLEDYRRFFIICEMKLDKDPATYKCLLSIEAFTGNRINDIYISFYETEEVGNYKYNLGNDRNEEFIFIIKSIKVVDKHDEYGPIISKDAVKKYDNGVEGGSENKFYPEIILNHKFGHVVGRKGPGGKIISRIVTIQLNRTTRSYEYNAIAGIMKYKGIDYDVLIHKDDFDEVTDPGNSLGYDFYNTREVSSELGNFFVYNGTIKYHCIYSFTQDHSRHHSHTEDLVINIQ